ncbi:MAG TPA: thioredoxin-disulfide reductase [Syntrophomonas sp.]|nr:thioredoxin-disulfide reductase [Syntrophomonas sp.]
MSEVYDLLILGGGPGGMAAGIYAGRAKMKTALVDKKGYGGQAITTAEVENYPGFGRGTTGPGLMEAMARHAESFDCEFIRDEIVEVDFAGSPKKITGRKDTYFGKVIILAPGAEYREMGVKGEKRLRGKGVSYCATCDAEFFEELDVVVVGSGDAAIEEAMFLTKFAETVTVIVLHDQGVVDANQVSAERAFANPRIKWIWNSVVESINGDGIVENVTLKNLKTGELSDYPTNGVFIFIGTIPKTEFLKGQVELDEQGYIITDDKMQTSMEGVYAAGDCRVKYLRQVITAAADGAIATMAAEKYLHESEGFEKQVIKAVKPVVLAYYTPCDLKSLEYAGMVEQIVKGSKVSLGFLKIDASRNELLTRRYQISALPCLQVFKEGKAAAVQAGMMDKVQVKDWINKSV